MVEAVVALIVVSETVVLAALPAIAFELHGLRFYTWPLGVELVAWGVGLAWGLRVEKRRRWAPIARGAPLAWAASSAVAAIPGSFGLHVLGDGANFGLIGARAVHGLACSLLVSIALSSKPGSVNRANRGRWLVVAGLPAMLGSVIGALVTDHAGRLVRGMSGWRWIFCADAILALAIFMVIRKAGGLEAAAAPPIPVASEHAAESAHATRDPGYSGLLVDSSSFLSGSGIALIVAVVPLMLENHVYAGASRAAVPLACLFAGFALGSSRDRRGFTTSGRGKRRVSGNAFLVILGLAATWLEGGVTEDGHWHAGHRWVALGTFVAGLGLGGLLPLTPRGMPARRCVGPFVLGAFVGILAAALGMRPNGAMEFWDFGKAELEPAAEALRRGDLDGVLAAGAAVESNLKRHCDAAGDAFDAGDDQAVSAAILNTNRDIIATANGLLGDIGDQRAILYWDLRERHPMPEAELWRAASAEVRNDSRAKISAFRQRCSGFARDVNDGVVCNVERAIALGGRGILSWGNAVALLAWLVILFLPPSGPRRTDS